MYKHMMSPSTRLRARTGLRVLLVIGAVAGLFGCGAGAASVYEVQRLEPGITEERVIERLGTPLDTERPEGEGGRRTRFEYNKEDESDGRIILYFVDGRLTRVEY